MNDRYLLYTIIFTTITILLLLIVMISVLYINYKQKLRQQTEVAAMRLAYEQELRQVESEVSDNMMERFAQELHDNIGHILTTMRLQIENRKLDSPGLEAVFQPIEASLDDASGQLRLLSRSLNTDYVSNIGLRAAIGVEVEKLQQLRRIRVDYTSSAGDSGLDKNQELMVFRIFQEMIHNTLRHSKASTVVINLFPGQHTLLVVKDDGKGFHADETMASAHASGLRNMIKRAQLAGLECTIRSAPGHGCTYTLVCKNHPNLNTVL